MIRAFLGAAAVVVVAIAAAQAAPWDQIARQCAVAAEAQMRAQTGCASCVGAWPSAAMCAVNHFYQGAIPQERTKACIDRIWSERFRSRACAQCGNPIADTFACVQG